MNRADRSRRIVYTHRWSYEHFIGPIPLGMQIDHLCHTNTPGCTGGAECRHRLCVNPNHLEVVTQAENLERSRHNRGAANAAKTHCPQGHPYDEVNTRRTSAGGRACRACSYQPRKAA